LQHTQLRAHDDCPAADVQHVRHACCRCMPHLYDPDFLAR
jgi:hypothetical protein